MKYLIVHGGGPTAVLNTSLYGVVDELMKSHTNVKVYSARGGIGAIFDEDYIDFSKYNHSQLLKLKYTPGTAIGSSRFPLEDEDYNRLAEKLHSQGIDGVLMNGGNGTMYTCSQLAKACAKFNIHVIGIPKTMDNDLENIDHSPGYGSAANYAASVTDELIQDVNALPIHVAILEFMGRNTGWISAAASFANEGKGPDLIYTPEVPFNEEEFLQDIEKLWKKKKGLVVVVSEGLKDIDGKSIVPLAYKKGRSEYFGDVSVHLANKIITELDIKARNEKPGLLGRTDMLRRSNSDVEEAEEVGRVAARAINDGYTNYMVGIKRENTDAYTITYPLLSLENISLSEKGMPRDFINEKGNGVTERYKKWAAPIVQYTSPDYFKKEKH